MVSREKINTIKQSKNPPPPFGYYHPKYSEVDKKPHHTNIHPNFNNNNLSKYKENIPENYKTINYSPKKL